MCALARNDKAKQHFVAYFSRGGVKSYGAKERNPNDGAIPGAGKARLESIYVDRVKEFPSSMIVRNRFTGEIKHISK